ncbi:hypothetical protein BGZ79_010555, partial [Entomortierella chlamydospora]
AMQPKHILARLQDPISEYNRTRRGRRTYKAVLYTDFLQEHRSWELGFLDKLSKPHLAPTQHLDHLGFTIDTQVMSLDAPWSKIRDIRREANKMIHKGVTTLLTRKKHPELVADTIRLCLGKPTASTTICRSLTFPDQDMVIDDDSYFSHAEPVDNIANDRSISEVNPAMDTIDVDEIDDDFSDLEPEKRLIEDDLGDLDDLPLEEIFSDDFGDHAPKKQLIKDDFADIATLPVDGFEDLTLGQSPASGYPPAVKETIQEEAALYDFDVDANRTNNGKNESTHDGFYADNAGETDNANIEDPSEQPITSDEQSALGHSGIPLKRSTNLIRPACRHLSCI